MQPGSATLIQGQSVSFSVSLSSSNGFTPIFYDPSATDARYLGVRVKPMLVPE